MSSDDEQDSEDYPEWFKRFLETIGIEEFPEYKQPYFPTWYQQLYPAAKWYGQNLWWESAFIPYAFAPSYAWSLLGRQLGAQGYYPAMAGAAQEQASRYWARGNIPLALGSMARGEYYGTMAETTWTATAYQALKLGSYFLPGAVLFRGFAFGPWAAGTTADVAARQAPYLREITRQFGPQTTMDVINRYGTLYAFRPPSLRETMISGGLEWTAGQTSLLLVRPFVQAAAGAGLRGADLAQALGAGARAVGGAWGAVGGIGFGLAQLGAQMLSTELAYVYAAGAAGLGGQLYQAPEEQRRGAIMWGGGFGLTIGGIELGIIGGAAKFAAAFPYANAMGYGLAAGAAALLPVTLATAAGVAFGLQMMAEYGTRTQFGIPWGEPLAYRRGGRESAFNEVWINPRLAVQQQLMAPQATGPSWADVWRAFRPSLYYDYIPPSGRLGPRVYAGSRWQPMPVEGLEQVPYVPYPKWSAEYQYPGMAEPVYAGMRGPREDPWWPMKTIVTVPPATMVAYRVPAWNYEYQYPGMEEPVTYGARYPEAGTWPREFVPTPGGGFVRNVTWTPYQYPGMEEPVSYGSRWISPWTGVAPSVPGGWWGGLLSFEGGRRTYAYYWWVTDPVTGLPTLQETKYVHPPPSAGYRDWRARLNAALAQVVGRLLPGGLPYGGHSYSWTMAQLGPELAAQVRGILFGGGGGYRGGGGYQPRQTWEDWVNETFTWSADVRGRLYGMPESVRYQEWSDQTKDWIFSGYWDRPRQGNVYMRYHYAPWGGDYFEAIGFDPTPAMETPDEKRMREYRAIRGGKGVITRPGSFKGTWQEYMGKYHPEQVGPWTPKTVPDPVLEEYRKTHGGQPGLIRPGGFKGTWFEYMEKTRPDEVFPWMPPHVETPEERTIREYRKIHGGQEVISTKAVAGKSSNWVWIPKDYDDPQRGVEGKGRWKYVQARSQQESYGWGGGYSWSGIWEEPDYSEWQTQQWMNAWLPDIHSYLESVLPGMIREEALRLGGGELLDVIGEGMWRKVTERLG